MSERSEESFDDSSDEDIYTNAVARFRAAKRKEQLKSRKNENVSPLIENIAPIEIIADEETTSINETRKESDVHIESHNIEIHDTSDSQSNSSTDSKSDSDLEITDVAKGIPTNRTDCIVLDPDTENLSMNESMKTDLSEGENYNIEVKILWRSHKLIHLEMRMHESFHSAFQYFEKLENVPVERILLLRNDKPIKPEDTPSSLGISVIDIVEGGVIDVEYSNDQGKGDNDGDENICKIKVQMSQKESITVKLQKNQPFKFAVLQCETQLNIPASKIKLYFDGDLINLSDTPESLDFDDEACIDLKITP